MDAHSRLLRIRNTVAIAAFLVSSAFRIAPSVEAEELLDFVGDHSSFASQQEFSGELFGPSRTSLISQSYRRAPSNRDWEVLPAGLLYHSYIAGPHEPRMALTSLYDSRIKEWRWDGTLGGRLGLFRSNQPQILAINAWQIDLEGAVTTRMDPQQHMDVESADYRFGLLWTAKQENVAWKFGYFHISSHTGDEYLIKHPGFDRINFVRESLIFGTSIQATPNLRVYGETAYALSTKGGAKPWQFQFGGELAALQKSDLDGAPFAAANVQLRQEVDFEPGVTLMTGWQWTGNESQKTWRVGLQYYNGRSNQYSFFRRRDNQLGLGVWYDY